MKNIVVLLLCLFVATAQAQEEPPGGEPVIVVNTPSVNIASQNDSVEVVTPRFVTDFLQSENFTLRAVPGASKGSQTVSFAPLGPPPDFPQQIALRDVSFAMIDTPSTGNCVIRVFVNEKLIKIAGSAPAGNLWQPPTGMPVIDLSSDDKVTVELEAVGTDRNEKGLCIAEVLTLGECRF